MWPRSTYYLDYIFQFILIQGVTLGYPGIQYGGHLFSLFSLTTTCWWTSRLTLPSHHHILVNISALSSLSLLRCCASCRLWASRLHCAPRGYSVHSLKHTSFVVKSRIIVTKSNTVVCLIAGREFRKIGHLVTSFYNFAWCYIYVYCFKRNTANKMG